MKKTSRHESPVFGNSIFSSRLLDAMQQELLKPERWHYFSFADTEFRGGVFMLSRGFVTGLIKINDLGINPGGEVIAWDVPDEHMAPESYRNRLLIRAEICEVWPDAKTLG